MHFGFVEVDCSQVRSFNTISRISSLVSIDRNDIDRNDIDYIGLAEAGTEYWLWQCY